jgi:hypothetical protein
MHTHTHTQRTEHDRIADSAETGALLLVFLLIAWLHLVVDYYSSGHKIFEANLTSQCNQNCDCSPNHLEPICGQNGITYFSPCHAGCTGANDLTQPGQSRFLVSQRKDNASPINTGNCLGKKYRKY